MKHCIQRLFKMAKSDLDTLSCKAQTEFTKSKSKSLDICQNCHKLMQDSRKNDSFNIPNFVDSSEDLSHWSPNSAYPNIQRYKKSSSWNLKLLLVRF